jgi:hypothetical protein
MLLRIGGLFVIAGLTFALLLGPGFAVVGGVLIVFGGIVLALAAEPWMTEQNSGAAAPADLIEQRDEKVA